MNAIKSKVFIIVKMTTYGVLVAFLTPRITSPSSDFGLGIAYGVIIWAAMTFIVLPLFNDVMRERAALMPFAWFIDHLVFGGSLALTPYFERIVDPIAYQKAISRSAGPHGEFEGLLGARFKATSRARGSSFTQRSTQSIVRIQAGSTNSRFSGHHDPISATR